MKAFKLFDTDGDGVITMEELKGLIGKVGGDMSEAEAISHIKAADADGNMALDFAEFGKLWEALHGAEEVINYAENEFISTFDVTLRTRSEESLHCWMLIRAVTLQKVLKLM